MTAEVNPEKLEQLVGKVIGDIASAMGVFMAYLGDQAGVYRALDEGGPQTIPQLAKRTGLNPKYLHEWLGANAAAGYVSYDAKNERFSLTPEQALVFTREGQPACMQGFFQALMAQFETHEKAVDTFVSGKGRGWGEHSACCFCSTDRFFRSGYAANLVDSWIPLDGVEAAGRDAKVADIGCAGSSTILMAKAYPNSTIVGIDFHEPSIQAAPPLKRASRTSNSTSPARRIIRARSSTSSVFDVAAMTWAIRLAANIRETLKPDGALFMLVEPRAGDSMA
ncbi:MAG: hypothetical protein R3C16_02480 [Hyphomonadaceae bacterium]